MNITPVNFNVLAVVVAVAANLFGFWLSFRTKLLRTGALLISTGILIAITIHAVAEFLESSGVISIQLLVRVMPVLVSAGVLLMAAGGIYVLYNVTRPLRIMTDRVLHFSSQDLPFEIDPKIKNSRNEIGDLALAFEKMVNNLKATTVSREHFRASEERTRSIIETANDAFISMDEEGIIMDWNRAAEHAFGWSREEAIGKPVAETIIPLSYRDAHREGLRRFIRTGEGPVIGKTVELSALHRDGHEFPVEITIWAVRRDKKYQFNAFVRDITERKKAQETLAKREKILRRTFEDLKNAHEELKSAQNQLVQSEKLASIGQLAAGVAHEINNPVGFINNNIEILEQYVGDYARILRATSGLKESVRQEDWARVKTAMREIAGLEAEVNMEYLMKDIPGLLRHTRAGIERVRKIVMDLRTFSRDDKDAVEQMKIEDVIEGILNIVHSEIRFRAELKRNYGDTPPVACNPQRLGQVFINLFMNAVQAMKEKGEIGIRTYRQDGYVCVDISDTGKGIPPEDISKIFDPFFTTKPVGQGTGLGLSVSYEIIKKHGGDIKVRSQVGQGTTFTVLLPLQQPNPEPR